MVGFQIKNGKHLRKRFYREYLDAISAQDEFSMNYCRHSKTVVLRCYYVGMSQKFKVGTWLDTELVLCKNDAMQMRCDWQCRILPYRSELCYECDSGDALSS